MTDTLRADDLLLAVRRLVPKVIESPFVRPGEVLLFNDLGRDVRYPPGWDDMTSKQKVEWGVANGMAIVVRNL